MSMPISLSPSHPSLHPHPMPTPTPISVPIQSPSILPPSPSTSPSPPPCPSRAHPIPIPNPSPSIPVWSLCLTPFSFPRLELSQSHLSDVSVSKHVVLMEKGGLGHDRGRGLVAGTAWQPLLRLGCRCFPSGVLRPCSFSQDIPVPLRREAPAALAQGAEVGSGLGALGSMQEPGLPEDSEEEPPSACAEGLMPGRRWWLCPPSPQPWWQRGTPVAIPALLSPRVASPR